eukprot:TRINITY_DN6608_c0_g1_i3.p1 TRINITY_DN6608_c0_g1~~TRINITY_DN6608_c0_g1_i3.p1  ORF type:complete len:297 (+),score=44.36 TRINITY_DN6608_c0_g1_i3:123-1013(+)
MIFSIVNHEIILNEINMLRLCRGHPNIVQLIEALILENRIYLVYEYFKYDNFGTLMESFTYQEIKHYLHELVKASRFLNSIGIVHRDIKPSNFLYSRAAKRGILIDFGLAEVEGELLEKLISRKEDQLTNEFVLKNLACYQELAKTQSILGSNKIGTEGFMPLESILYASRQSYSVDSWAIGIIFLELLSKKHPFFHNLRLITGKKHPIQVYYLAYILELVQVFGSETVRSAAKDFGFLLELPSDLPVSPTPLRSFINNVELDEVGENFLTGLLQLDPRMRMSTEAALRHKFFAEF